MYMYTSPPLCHPRRPGLRLPVLARRASLLPLVWILLALLRPALEPPFVRSLAFTRLRNLLVIVHRAPYPFFALRLGLFHVTARVLHPNSRLRLLFVRRIKIRRLTAPSLVRFRCELFHHSLPRDLVLLFWDSRRIISSVAKPLMPLRCSHGISQYCNIYAYCQPEDVYARDTFTSA